MRPLRFRKAAIKGIFSKSSFACRRISIGFLSWGIALISRFQYDQITDLDINDDRIAVIADQCPILNSRQTRCLIPADGLREFFYSEQREAVPVPFGHGSDDKSFSGAMLAGLHAAQLQEHLAQRISRQFELRI